MVKNNNHFTNHDLRRVVVELLEQRGVTLQAIAQVVYDIQHAFYPELTLELCLESVEAVIDKREVQHVLLTGIALDMAAEAGNLPEPLLSILRDDNLLYGVDEVLALGITNVYGSIGLTNFGYLDKQKIGIIGELNSRRQPGRVHTFLDDLVAGVAAAAAARLAHALPDKLSEADLALPPEGRDRGQQAAGGPVGDGTVAGGAVSRDALP